MNKVQIFNIQKLDNGTSKYRVKWRVQGNDKTRAFKNKAAAESFRKTLTKALDQGLVFDPKTGEPVQWALSQMSFAECASEYVALKWEALAASSRKSMVEALSYSVIFLTKDRGRENHSIEALSKAARLEVLKPKSENLDDKEVRAAAKWIRQNSLRLSEISVKTATQLLENLNQSSVEDRKVSAKTLHRRRQAVNAVFVYAKKMEYKEKNPIEGAEYTKRRLEEAINPKELPTPAECREVTRKLEKQGPLGKRAAMFFSILWLAGLRPSEALALKKQDIVKTQDGEIEILVSKAAVQVGRAWTGTSSAQALKQPKARAEGHVRVVPVPDELRAKLLPFISKLKTDELLFPARKNKGSLIISTLAKAWKDNRQSDVTLYDLRHLNATLLIYSGLNVIEVASRLGHSVSVCSRIYSHVMREFEKTSNQKVNEFLRNH